MSNSKRKTPYFLVELENLHKEFLSFKLAISKYNREDIIAFAIKANYDEKILDTLYKLGAYFEVSSYYEYSMLIKKMPPERIIINGCINTKYIMKKYFISKSLIIVDSFTRLKWLNDLNIPTRIGIRLNIDTVISNNNSFIKKNNRFGIPINDFYKLFEYKNISVICLHIHISNHTKHPNNYYLFLDIMCKLAKKYNLTNLKYIDIGGGYKIAEQFWSFEDYTNMTLKALAENNMEHIKIIYEPGNSITGSSTSYTTKVIDKKRINNITYIILDGFKYHINFSNQTINTPYDIIRTKNSNIQKVNKQIIAGCSCKTSDIFFELDDDYELNIGDQIVFLDLGSYTANRSSNFLVKKAKIYYNQ